MSTKKKKGGDDPLQLQQPKKKYKDSGNDLVWHDENGRAWQQADPKGYNYKVNPNIKGNKPIYVTDPNDSRLIAYQDSLALYNNNPITRKFYKGLSNKELGVDDSPNYVNSAIRPIGYDASVNDGHITYDAAYKKPVQPVELKKRERVNIVELPSLSINELASSRVLPKIETPSVYFPQSKYKEGVLKQDFKGVPNIEVWSKRGKEDNILRPMALVNQAGESIDYNEYKAGKFPEGFQYPQKMKNGGFVNSTEMNGIDPRVLQQLLQLGQDGKLGKPQMPDMNTLLNPTLSYQDSKGMEPLEKKNPYPYDDASYSGVAPVGSKPTDASMMGIRGAAGGIGAVGTVVANTGRPDPLLGALSGAGQGFAYGGPVGAIIGGLVGLGTAGINRSKYEDASEQRERGKIKAATVFGTDLGMYEAGGNVEGEQGELNPVQLEKGEVITMPDGSIFRAKSKKLHKQMDPGFVTDILPTGIYVASNSKKEAIAKKKADEISLGYDVVTYDEDGNSSVPTERFLGDHFRKNKMTPAEILEIVKHKFPTNDDVEFDPFLKRANKGNLKARLPYINAVIQANL